jgi:hypothetical protein
MKKVNIFGVIAFNNMNVDISSLKFIYKLKSEKFARTLAKTVNIPAFKN